MPNKGKKQGRDGGRDAHQGRVRLGHNAFRHVVRQKWSLLRVDVRMQEDLRAAVSSVSHSICSEAHSIYMSSEHTWFAAGLILADASRIVRSSIPKLLTPMLMRRCASQFNIIPKLLRTEPGQRKDGDKSTAPCRLLLTWRDQLALWLPSLPKPLECRAARDLDDG
jgi:hypothetical protein